MKLNKVANKIKWEMKLNKVGDEIQELYAIATCKENHKKYTNCQVKMRQQLVIVEGFAVKKFNESQNSRENITKSIALQFYTDINQIHGMLQQNKVHGVQ